GISSTAQIEDMLGRMYDLAVLEREVREEGISYQCLEEGGALVAFASWGALEREDDDGGEPTAKLHKLYVDPDRQRRGHGRQLLARGEARAPPAGLLKLVRQGNNSNPSTLRADP